MRVVCRQTPTSNGPAPRSSWGLSRLLQVLAAKELGDLHGVEGGTLAEIVAHHPQAEPVLDGRILADPADVGRILADRLDRGDVAAVLALIDHHHSRRLPEDGTGLIGRDFILELDV